MTLLAIAVIMGSIVFIYMHRGNKVLKIITILFLIGILFYCYSQAPRSYILTKSDIIINTTFKKIAIPISSIKEVKRLKKEEVRGGIRLRGIGGLFGFKGRFYSPAIGEFEGYFTNQNNLILIRGEKIYVISPDNPNLFLGKIKQ